MQKHYNGATHDVYNLRLHRPNVGILNVRHRVKELTFINLRNYVYLHTTTPVGRPLLTTATRDSNVTTNPLHRHNHNLTTRLPIVAQVPYVNHTRTLLRRMHTHRTFNSAINVITRHIRTSNRSVQNKNLPNRTIRLTLRTNYVSTLPMVNYRRDLLSRLIISLITRLNITRRTTAIQLQT